MRAVRWPGCINCRDLGGVRLSSGFEIAPGLVYRSASLADLDAAVAGRLRNELGIETYIDLRDAEEVARDSRPHTLERSGIERVPMPLADGENPIRRNPHPQPGDYARGYLHTVAVGGATIAQALAAVATATAPLAFGCSLGKDRTGIIAMLILLACGAPIATIGREHALSARQLRRSLPQLRGQIERKRISERAFRRRIEATAATAELFVGWWLEKVGSLDAGWASLGVERGTVEMLRSRLVRRIEAADALHG